MRISIPDAPAGLHPVVKVCQQLCHLNKDPLGKSIIYASGLCIHIHMHTQTKTQTHTGGSISTLIILWASFFGIVWPFFMKNGRVISVCVRVRVPASLWVLKLMNFLSLMEELHPDGRTTVLLRLSAESCAHWRAWNQCTLHIRACDVLLICSCFLEYLCKANMERSIYPVYNIPLIPLCD